MATVSQNIETIRTQAAALDALVIKYRAAAATIEVAELEIRKAQPGSHDARAGRIRLAHYAHALMGEPDIAGRKSVATLASEAWAGVS